jgi:adenylate kinase family enzyme
MNLGKKILVVGVSASGKSIFSRELSRQTGIPVTHVDALMWKPDWNYIGDEETVKLLDEVSQRPAWIIEGFIEKEARLFLTERTDTIIYLDYSRLTTAWRYIKRSWKHRKDPRPELEGSPDKFSFMFLMRIWQKKEMYHLKKTFASMSNQDKLVTLTTPKEARTLIRNLTATKFELQ